MKVSPSNADMQFLEALETEGLTKIGGFKFNSWIYLPVAKPEAQWEDFQLSADLDGPPHLKDRQRVKDEFRDTVLTHYGWTPLRFPYPRFPIPKYQLNQILAQLKEVLLNDYNRRA